MGIVKYYLMKQCFYERVKNELISSNDYNENEIGEILDKLREFCKNCAEEDKKLYEKRKSQTYTRESYMVQYVKNLFHSCIVRTGRLHAGDRKPTQNRAEEYDKQNIYDE